MSKNGEYISVGVYNLSNGSKSITDSSLVVCFVSFQYNDGYTNAAEIPSIKIDGGSIGDDFAKLDKLYGEAEEIQFDTAIFERYWSWQEDQCNIHAVKMSNKVYAIEVNLPIE